jgi:hypothetical protein
MSSLCAAGHVKNQDGRSNGKYKKFDEADALRGI